VVDGVFGDDDRLPWLDRMLLPTAREVRDRLDTDVLTTEVLLPCEGTLIRWVKGRSAEREAVEVLDLRGGVEDRDVLVVSYHDFTGARFHSSGKLFVMTCPM
jgi:hypothetical protein